MSRRILAAAAAAALLATLLLGYHIGQARAAGIPPSNTLSYTGTLLSYGQPDNGSHAITLNLWAGDSIACQTTSATTVQLVNGRFTLPLDASCVPVVHANPSLNVEVVVDGTSMGQTPLGAVPYSVEADTASNAATGSTLAQLDPPGTVIAYAGTVGGPGNLPPPAGWLLCDGSAVSRTQYAALFAAIGANSGPGDGSTTFDLPDYRGYFLRGYDQGNGIDPDAATRTAQNGGNTGDAVGTVETGQIQAHYHPITDKQHDHGGVTGGIAGAGGTDWDRDYDGQGAQCTRALAYSTQAGCSNDYFGHTHTIAPSYTGITQTNMAGGSETRPLNVSVNYLIKY